MRNTNYFIQVQSQMVHAGFPMVSKVIITDKDCPYHIPVDCAIHTNFLFHKPGKGFLISLQNENYCKDGKETDFWSLETILLYPQCWLDTVVPGYTEAFPIPHFRDYGRVTDRTKDSSILIEQTYNSNGPLEPHMLVTAIETLWQAIEIHLIDGKFPYLWMTCLWPHYTFPKSEEIFWNRFDLRYLKGAVANYFKGDYFKKKFAKNSNPER